MMFCNHFTIWIEYKSRIEQFAIFSCRNSTNKVDIVFFGQTRHMRSSWTIDCFSRFFENLLVRLVEVIEALWEANHSWFIFRNGFLNYFRQMLQCIIEICFGVELNQCDSEFCTKLKRWKEYLVGKNQIFKLGIFAYYLFSTDREQLNEKN